MIKVRKFFLCVTGDGLPILIHSGGSDLHCHFLVHLLIDKGEGVASCDILCGDLLKDLSVEARFLEFVAAVFSLLELFHILGIGLEGVCRALCLAALKGNTYPGKGLDGVSIRIPDHELHGSCDRELSFLHLVDKGQGTVLRQILGSDLRGLLSVQFCIGIDVLIGVVLILLREPVRIGLDLCQGDGIILPVECQLLLPEVSDLFVILCIIDSHHMDGLDDLRNSFFFVDVLDGLAVVLRGDGVLFLPVHQDLLEGVGDVGVPVIQKALGIRGLQRLLLILFQLQRESIEFLNAVPIGVHCLLLQGDRCLLIGCGLLIDVGDGLAVIGGSDLRGFLSVYQGLLIGVGDLLLCILGVELLCLRRLQLFGFRSLQLCFQIVQFFDALSVGVRRFLLQGHSGDLIIVEDSGGFLLLAVDRIGLLSVDLSPHIFIGNILLVLRQGACSGNLEIPALSLLQGEGGIVQICDHVSIGVLCGPMYGDGDFLGGCLLLIYSNFPLEKCCNSRWFLAQQVIF